MHLPITMAATSYLVGGAKGWHTPSKPNYYDEWLKGKKFVKHNVLHFIFKENEHTLTTVKTKEAYDKCNIIATGLVDKWGDTIWILNEVAINYAICTLHCAKGQKVIIDVKVIVGDVIKYISYDNMFCVSFLLSLKQIMIEILNSNHVNKSEHFVLSNNQNLFNLSSL